MSSVPTFFLKQIANSLFYFIYFINFHMAKQFITDETINFNVYMKTFCVVMSWWSSSQLC